jgi:hypothetical protein
LAITGTGVSKNFIFARTDKFYEEQNRQCELLKEDFYRNAEFLCDIMSKQNDLNISLQGETKSIYNMWQKIQAFRKKLFFFQNSSFSK